jgi:hypothetical protein
MLAPRGNTFSDAQLTDEQVDFVRSLGASNVPAADIARVIERMKMGDGVGIEGPSRGVMNSVNPGLAPPRYESIDSIPPVM